MPSFYVIYLKTLACVHEAQFPISIRSSCSLRVTSSGVIFFFACSIQLFAANSYFFTSGHSFTLMWARIALGLSDFRAHVILCVVAKNFVCARPVSLAGTAVLCIAAWAAK